MMSDTDTDKQYGELVDRFNTACALVDAKHAAIEEAKADENTTEAQRDKLVEEFTGAVAQRDRYHQELRSKEALEKARDQYKPLSLAGKLFQVKEPDIYTATGRSFMTDLYASQIKNDGDAQERITKHQRHEVEKYAITSATFGGIIPPAYLVDMYAKASRNGRVFADQVNQETLPDVGMSVIVPRLTQGLAAAAQTTQNTAVVTQDITETDLSPAVNTISGYSPVSRQGIERAAYSDKILFEDLVARYWAILDTYCINGSGSNNQPLGLLQTGSISASTASTATVAGVWPKVADVIQQINSAVGGLGYVADKIIMHPRRWGFFEAAVDTQGRPLFGINGQPAFNVVGEGSSAGYGYVGRMHGLPVFTDANIPTNTGATTNQDSIIVIASPVVHLWERANDPVTLAFEQTGATNLTVNLICYGYVAFTAGRYPAASGAVTGQGLVPPTF
jgi:HK97 family phage major capsid protein